MAFCEKCGAQLHGNAAFCTACGGSIRQSAQTSTIAAPVVTPLSKASYSTARGFLDSLFDFSFTNFVTTKVIKFLFVLSIVVAGLAALQIIKLSANSGSGISPMLALILAPIVFFGYVLLARVWLEIIMVVFRMAEHLAEIAQQGKK